MINHDLSTKWQSSSQSQYYTCNPLQGNGQNQSYINNPQKDSQRQFFATNSVHPSPPIRPINPCYPSNECTQNSDCFDPWDCPPIKGSSCYPPCDCDCECDCDCDCNYTTPNSSCCANACDTIQGNSVDVKIRKGDYEVRADVVVSRTRTVRVWGRVKDCDGNSIANALVKLVRIIEGCNLFDVESLSHTITDCNGFYQFEVDANKLGGCYKVIVNKASSCTNQKAGFDVD